MVGRTGTRGADVSTRGTPRAVAGAPLTPIPALDDTHTRGTPRTEPTQSLTPTAVRFLSPSSPTSFLSRKPGKGSAGARVAVDPVPPPAAGGDGKRCTRCGWSEPEVAFTRRYPRKRDGLSSWCDECHRRATRRWRERNR